jgi:GntR family transcriptional regulator, rspAB operon transcriptional repressor
MTKKPIFTTSLVDQVYEYLLEKIISNDLSYGDNLNIKDLSETLGISTMPVREAIKRLEYDRVVEVKPRSSCQIRVPGKDEIISIYELREDLELFAIKKFLHAFDPSKLKNLEDIITKMKAVKDIKPPETRIRETMTLDQQFHKELCVLGDNEYLCLYHRQLTLHLNMAAIHAKSYQQLEDKWIQSHMDIIDHLKQQSPEALNSLEQHFDNVWAVLDKG